MFNSCEKLKKRVIGEFGFGGNASGNFKPPFGEGPRLIKGDALYLRKPLECVPFPYKHAVVLPIVAIMAVGAASTSAQGQA